MVKMVERWDTLLPKCVPEQEKNKWVVPYENKKDKLLANTPLLIRLNFSHNANMLLLFKC